MTTFQNPLKTRGVGGDTGLPATDTTSYVTQAKIVSLGGGATAPRQIITIPSNSTLLRMGGVVTSALAADVSAVNISFGNSADATHYGIIAVSALGQVRTTTVSAATEFDNVTVSPFNTIVIVVSAVSTTTFTAGGVRAFVEYVTTE